MKQQTHFMSKLTRLFVLGILVFSTLAIVVPLSAQDEQGEDMDMEAPPLSAETVDAALNAGDIDSMMPLYAEDVISMPPNLPHSESKEALRGALEGLLENNEVQLDTTLIRRHISEALIVEIYEYEETITPLGDGEAATFTGTQVITLEKIDGEWKIVAQIWNTDGSSS